MNIDQGFEACLDKYFPNIDKEKHKDFVVAVKAFYVAGYKDASVDHTGELKRLVKRFEEGK